MNISDYKIGTLGSHSALQILKGAKDEGFETVVVTTKERELMYKSFGVADNIIFLDSMSDAPGLEKRLLDEKIIMVPHASFFTAFGLEKLLEMKMLYFGNKQILTHEESREKQRQWLKQAGLTLPKMCKNPEDIDGPTIIKFYGASGGKGYFLAHNPKEFNTKIKEHPGKSYIIQEYIIGAPIYIHYFYSPLTDELEVMSMDKRYETNVDSIGRISARDQLDLNIESSYNIMGNIPVVVRESLLPEIFEMGRKVVDTSKEFDGNGLFGPFCLETIVTPELDFYVFEISARIVAGTNPYINGSPYSDLKYDIPMSTGRRIAREIKNAIEQNKLEDVLK